MMYFWALDGEKIDRPSFDAWIAPLRQILFGKDVIAAVKAINQASVITAELCALNASALFLLTAITKETIIIRRYRDWRLISRPFPFMYRM